jgi:kynurenine formamidase
MVNLLPEGRGPWGWDGPLDRQAKDALATQKPDVFWPAHQSDLPYSQLERLVNLGSLPAFGFKVACFSLKIRGGGAGPARVLAILPDSDIPDLIVPAG